MAVEDLADLVICGKDSDDDTVCDHHKPAQWVCSRCSTPNWESKWACRNCWHQHSLSDWFYPARRLAPRDHVRQDHPCRPCVDCGLVTSSICERCCAQTRWTRRQRMQDGTAPLCVRCSGKWAHCHMCRGVSACTPFPHGHDDYSVRPDRRHNEMCIAAGPMGRYCH